MNMSPNCKYFIDTYSSTSQPTQVEISSPSKGMLKELVDNKSVTEYLEKHEYSPTELMSFTTTDSVKLDFSMIKPFDFDASKKYPVILAIYGGPGSQAVYDRFGSSGFDQYLAQKGYIIIDVNNRATANYSSHFMKQVYKQLGKWESNDFVETAKYLSTLPYVDKDNMAIMGTSYGGYSTTYTMLAHPGVFKVGIANSPVTDWRLYDDIYTERYMGLLSDNEDGYIKSASTTYAKNLQGHLLLIHSDLDDNVHIANTMQLLTALTNAGKDFDLRIFPPGAHGAAYNMQSYFLLMQIYYNYLDRHLKGGGDQININE
jgi:dipeptidyl-peptidase-4